MTTTFDIKIWRFEIGNLASDDQIEILHSKRIRFGKVYNAVFGIALNGWRNRVFIGVNLGSWEDKLFCFAFSSKVRIEFKYNL